MFFFSSRSRHTSCALVTGVQTCALPILAGKDIEQDQRGKALAVRRDLKNTATAICGRYRRHVLSALSGEIVERVSAAQRAQIGHHVISDRPIIEPFATVSRNCPQDRKSTRLNSSH